MIGATSLGQPRSRFRFLRAYSSPAQDYLRRVINADLASNTGAGIIRIGVCNAIAAFIDGAIADGLLSTSAGVISQATSKIKASCIMMGANTLSGALTPLVGPAPTNFNFVGSDYNPKTGLIGNGSTKYLDTNRNNNADPQNSNHLAVYVTSAHSLATVAGYIGASAGAATGATHIAANGVTNVIFARSRSATSADLVGAIASTTGFIAMNRSSGGAFTTRHSGATSSHSIASETPFDGNVLIYNRATTTAFSNGRISFYGVGESVDPALLDARVTAMANSIAAVLP